MNHDKTAKITAAILLLTASGMVNANDVGTVPEPGPIGLLIMGGVALFIAKRMRKNRE